MNGKRLHPPEFKASVALEAMQAGAEPARIAAAHGIHISLVYAWRQQLTLSMADIFRPEAGTREKQPESRKLVRTIKRLRAEQEWLRLALTTIPRRRRADMVERDGELSIAAQARLLGLHRSMVYYQSEKNSDEGAEIVPDLRTENPQDT